MTLQRKKTQKRKELAVNFNQNSELNHLSVRSFVAMVIEPS